MDYASSGVNIELGDTASKMLYEAARKTFDLRRGDIGEVIVPFDDFSGIRLIALSRLPKDAVMGVGFDGVGTKVEVCQRMRNHRTVAFDLLAMVCDDAIVRGAEPVLVGSILDVNSLVSATEDMRQLAQGYYEAAVQANVAIINGELAELGQSVSGFGKFAYHWSASVIWFARKSKLHTGTEVKPGDAIVVLREKGFRSNGFSLARKVFEATYGKEWHNVKLNGKALGDHLVEPSTIYSKAVVHMHGGLTTPGNCEIHGVAHITGGGLPSKVGRVLKPTGLGAVLDGLFEPCSAMLHCQEVGSVEDKEAYRTWNMGQGLAVITPEPERVIAEATKYNIIAQRAGTVTKEPGIVIVSQGHFSKGKRLVFE